MSIHAKMKNKIFLLFKKTPTVPSPIFSGNTYVYAYVSKLGFQ